MPQLTTEQAADIVDRQHPEYREWSGRWRWLLDSYDAGQRYRDAVYGWDSHGLPIRNMIRHPREVPDPRDSNYLAGTSTYAAGIAQGPGSLPASGLLGSAAADGQYANCDDYELRRARTPTPTFVREAVDTHLATIFEKRVDRKGPDAVAAWWADVDGLGTGIDDWVGSVAGPLLLTLGALDVCVDRPPAPEGAAIRTKADLTRLGLDRAVASCILPDNLPWWLLAPDGRYAECLVIEHDADPASGDPVRRYRHWDADGSTLLDDQGVVLGYHPHPYGRVPIERVFFRRRPRYTHIGLSRYEGIAERQREYYNRESELILSDTTQAHPLLQGPEDYIQADGTIPVGPNYLLPKKKNSSGTAVSYEGFSVVDFPKGAADSIRENLAKIRDEIDRDACLTKPAGTPGTSGKTVAQSGVSKQLDHVGGHRVASQICKVLARLEMTLSGLVQLVLADGGTPPESPPVEVAYPTSFNLMAADELAAAMADFQSILGSAGDCPSMETLALRRLALLMCPGEPQAVYDDLDAEIDAAVAAKAVARDRQGEADLMRLEAAPPAATPAGNDGQGAGATPDAPPEYESYPGGGVQAN